MLLLSLLVLAAFPPDGPAPRATVPYEPDPGRYETQTVAIGLDHPWSVAFHRSGDVLVTERAGRLRVVRDGVLLEQPVVGVPDVHAASQAGLFEVVFHPNAARDLVYLSFAAGEPGDNTLALARARYVPTEAGGRLEDVETLFEAMPRRTTDAHYGGRMAWMPDGTLLLTSGEAYGSRHLAQKLDGHLGKVLRLTEEGDAPADNPFVGVPGTAPEIWSYGHRNPQGVAVLRGTVYETEHGPMGGDELNVIRRGENYGWPIASYGTDYSGAFVTPFTEAEGTVQPVTHWTPSIAPSGLAVYDGALFPGWRGDLLVPALAERGVRRVDLAAPSEQEILFGELEARIRDVAVAPDGAVWLAVEDGADGRLVRVVPAR